MLSPLHFKYWLVSGPESPVSLLFFDFDACSSELPMFWQAADVVLEFSFE